MNSVVGTTLRVQPAVILFSTVSILTKLASGYLQEHQEKGGELIGAILSDWRIIGLLALMFLVLGTYAVIWQILIKNAQIAVIYANKSSSLLWKQLAAVLFFGECISWKNILGLIVIFAGIFLANAGGNHERA